jgi:UrcA family protein
MLLLSPQHSASSAHSKARMNPVCVGAVAMAAAMALFAAGAPAMAKQADDARDMRRIAVSTAGVNFTNPADVDALHRRVLRAAVRVCGGDLRLAPGPAARRNRCVQRAADSAIEAAGLAPLMVLHANLTEKDRYRSWRTQPDEEVMRLVAEAGGGGANAGTIYQPD